MKNKQGIRENVKVKENIELKMKITTAKLIY